MPRSAGYKHLQKTRDKIQAAQLINRLDKHINADKPLMDASQVNAAKALLNKVLPDLRAIDHTTDGEKINLPSVVERRAVGAGDPETPPSGQD